MKEVVIDGQRHLTVEDEDYDTLNIPQSEHLPSNSHQTELIKNLRTTVLMASYFPTLAYQAEICRYVLIHGKFFMASLRPKKFRKGPNKQCFSNSLTLTMSNPDLVYVEGFAFSKSDSTQTIEHAWCATADNAVIDLTWPKPGTVYFGVAFDREVALGHLHKCVDEGYVDSIFSSILIGKTV